MRAESHLPHEELLGRRMAAWSGRHNIAPSHRPVSLGWLFAFAAPFVIILAKVVS